MKYIKTREDIIFEELLNESVIYLSPSTIYALERIKKTPINSWGIQGFIKGQGNDIKEVNDQETGEKKQLKGKYITRDIVIEFIDKMLALNYTDIESNIIFADLVLDTSSNKNKVEVNFIPDNTIKALDKNNKLDRFQLDVEIIDNEPSKVDGNKISNKLSNLYDTLKLNFSGKLGKFLNSLNIKDKSGKPYPPAVIEEVAKKITLYIVNGKLAEVDETLYELKEITGKEINDYYTDKIIIGDLFSDHEDNLNQSCMIGSECKGFFGIYTDNPKQVSLLVYIEKESGKLLGRALIWTNSSGDRIMDTIYATNSHAKSIFNKYKEEHCTGDFTEIKLDNIEFDLYPYLDTFYFADFANSYLSTKLDRGYVSIRTKNGILDSTISPSLYYSEVPEDLDESDFVYSKFYNGYLEKYDSVETEDGDIIHVDDSVEYDDGTIHLKAKSINLYDGTWTSSNNSEIVELTEEYYSSDINQGEIAYANIIDVAITNDESNILREDAKLVILDISFDELFDLELGVIHQDNDEEYRLGTCSSTIFMYMDYESVEYNEDATYGLELDNIIGIDRDILTDGEFPFEKLLIDEKIYDVDGTPFCSIFLDDTSDLELHNGSNGLLKQLLYIRLNGSINGIGYDDIVDMYTENFDEDMNLIKLILEGLETIPDEDIESYIESINIGTEYTT